MAIFVKTETIKKKYLLDSNLRRIAISNHINWVKKLKSSGVNIKSGFLIDKNKKPGGGGVLIIECGTYAVAEKIIKVYPMIKNKIVEWNLYEWIEAVEKLN